MKWNEVTKFELKGTVLVIKDAMIMLNEDESEPEWPSVNCQSGEYIFEINVVDSWTCHRLRIRKTDSNPEIGSEVGIVDIDHAFVGIIDYENFLKAVSSDYDAYEEWTGMELDDELGVNFSGEINFNNEKLLYVKSGEGDGSYRVFELKQNDEIVGMECVFIN